MLNISACLILQQVYGETESVLRIRSWTREARSKQQCVYFVGEISANLHIRFREENIADLSRCPCARLSANDWILVYQATVLIGCWSPNFSAIQVCLSRRSAHHLLQRLQTLCVLITSTLHSVPCFLHKHSANYMVKVEWRVTRLTSPSSVCEEPPQMSLNAEPHSSFYERFHCCFVWKCFVIIQKTNEH